MVLTTIRVFLIFLVVLFTMGQTSFDKEETTTIPTSLKCTKEKILFYNKISRSEEIRHEKNALGKYERIKYITPEHMTYLYASDVEVPTVKGEDISKRTKSAQFFKGKKKDEWTARLYAGEPFYFNRDRWYQTETNKVTVDAFEKVCFWDWLFNSYAVATTTTYYSGAGDGYIYRNQDESWNTIHDAYVGSPNYTQTYAWAQANGYWYYGLYLHDISRAFFPVDTSGLPDDATINSATFNFYVAQVTSSKFRLVLTTNWSPTQLQATAYPQCGAVDDPTAGATDITISSIGWKSFTLNATGRGWISKTGYTKIGIRECEYDAEDDVASGYRRIQIRTSEYASTTYDPYLSITYNETADRRIMSIH